MTARIVNAWGDARPADELERAAEERQSEDNLHSSKRAVPCESCGRIHAGEPGQLWERVAVSTTQGAVYPTRLKAQLADNYMRDLGTRLDVEIDAMVRVPYRGPAAAERADRSNGVRRYSAQDAEAEYMRTQHRHYRHTGFEAGAL